MSFPLNGVKVLDMSRVLAGPFAGRMLADLGADVVKLEPPEGDITRLWGLEIGGIAGYYNQQNAGKRNIAVDLSKSEGAELVKSLVKEADVLIENFRPDVMGRLGLDYDTLAEVNPRLIMLSISGFGAGNPDSRRAAYAPIVHAEIGLVARQAEISNAYPAELALSVADTNAGLHGLVGLLAALYARETSGKGDHLEIAMVDASVVTNDGMGFVLDDMPQVVTNEVFETAAGPLMIAGDFRFIWKMLTRHFGVEDGLGDAEVALQEKIDARRAAVHTFFNEICADREAVIAALDTMNIAWGDVRPREEIHQLASVKARGTIAQVDDRDGSTRPIPESPYRYRHLKAEVQGGAPHLGEHNQVVFADWLGWSDQDLEPYQDVLVSE
ncbi:MAG: CoA transferase [Pseudomonadales bacterium]|nr:CoA transferase [Pseudomonadales bacterium]MBO6595751.1 CoA transferase [Pseudomonadales bacterium]MBO6820691.1 CoA transferase [Pseudomonadales bacterium]